MRTDLIILLRDLLTSNFANFPKIEYKLVAYIREVKQQLYYSRFIGRMGRNNSDFDAIELGPARYSHITFGLRTSLIEMVISKGFSIYRAAKSLKINNSTAKVIIRNYRRRGHIYKRKSQRNKPRQHVQTKKEGLNSQFPNQGRAIQAANMENQYLELRRDPTWVNLSALPYIFYPVYSIDQYSFDFGC